jgi:hypothetical protein
MNEPQRAQIDPAFLAALGDLALARAPNWWADVLRRDDLVIAVRRNALNVYFRGASIYEISWEGGRIRVRMHLKYLVRQQQTYVDLVDGKFDTGGSGKLQDVYQGPETLDEMIRAAKPLTGAEKAGLHPLLISEPRLIDVEVALTRDTSSSADDKREQDRIDAAVLRPLPNGKASVVFYEAKHFSNSALRASAGRRPDVLRQLEDYARALERYSVLLTARYVETATALVHIDNMRRSLPGMSEDTRLDPMFFDIAAGEQPTIDTTPRLLIFGFDAAQRDSADWRHHLERLGGKSVRTIGKPTTRTRAFRN